ncbi:MAG: peptidase M15 [Bacteroidetes bacterium]|nr:peptidase M15 [Bacteroidota bacterium]
MQITPHFTLEELVFSSTALRHGLDNTPGEAEVANLTRLCEVLLEPARDLLGGVAFKVDSGFRSRELNALVHGVPSSAHLDGRAADVVPDGLDLALCFEELRKSDLPFDQIIFECHAWIHLAVARVGEQPRREALMAIKDAAGRFSYQKVPA